MPFYGVIYRDHANFLINVYLNEYKGEPLRDPHEKLRNDMFAYERQDLEELLCNLMELQKAVFFFHCYHQPREKTKDYLKDMLSIRQIQEARRGRTQKPVPRMPSNAPSATAGRYGSQHRTAF